MRTAVIQFNAGADKKINILKALKFIEAAIKLKAKFILLPEMFHYRGDPTSIKDIYSVAEEMSGESLLPLMQVARKHKIYLLGGSIIEKAGKRVYNTSVLIDPNGKIRSIYRKMHLFRAQINTTTVQESNIFSPGNQAVVGRVGEFKLGMSICYDLRFPDLYQNYRKRGVDILAVPSCFTRATGVAHWEVLLRARAIETQSYVLAPNQIGKDGRGVESFGNSMIVDPWGKVLSRASSNKEEIILADISMPEIKKTQKILPGFRKIF